MTDDPIWPGVAEYLYHAAWPASVVTEGTWTVPSALSPRCSSVESTPMAGICTDTGSERASHGPRAVAPVTPACDAAGCGACAWEPAATPTAAAPARMSRTPAVPATRARRPAEVVGGGAYPVCGQTTTTRNPAMRRHGASGNVAVLSSAVLLRYPNIPMVNWPLHVCAGQGPSLYAGGAFGTCL